MSKPADEIVVVPVTATVPLSVTAPADVNVPRLIAEPVDLGAYDALIEAAA